MATVVSDPGTVQIRVPVAKPGKDVGAPAFTVDGPLAGKRVGIRHEGSWRSWMLISADWEGFLRRDGAEPVVIQTGERVGEEGVRTRAEIDEWAKSVDFAVSGLGTCGSCTSWTVHDAVSVEKEAKPAVAVVCEEFETHGRNMATHLGHPDMKVLVLPYPLEARPEEELHQIAEEYYPRFLELVGVTA